MTFDRYSFELMYSRTCDHAPRLRALPGLAFCLVLAACGANTARITQDSFSVDSPYKSKLNSNSTVACESARRALLGDGYIIDAYSKENVKGRKAYRMESDRSTFIEMNVVCVDDSDGAMVYANGVLSTYDVKRSGASASVGVSALGSVSLPFGQSAESMVKTSDDTIREKEFYRRFFNAVTVVMVRIKAARKAAERPAVPLNEPTRQGKPGSVEYTQSVSSHRNDNTRPAETEELPPTPLVAPARTAEALEAAHVKPPEKPASAEMLPSAAGESPSGDNAPVTQEEVTPNTSGESAPAAPSATSDPGLDTAGTPDPEPAPPATPGSEPAGSDGARVTLPAPESEDQPPAAGAEN
jgi:hypothetical protein